MMREVRWHTLGLLLCCLVSVVSAQNGIVKCGGSWQQLDDKCFLAVAGSKQSWKSARGDCQKRAGADLAVIPDDATNTFLKTMLSGVSNAFWIGLHDLPKEDWFEWVDGDTLANKNFTKWAPNNPNNGFIFGEDCVSFVPTTAKWRDDFCSSSKSFICERNVTSIPKCDESNGWRSYNGKCFQFFNDYQPWQTAEDTCAFYKEGHLAYVQSEQDQDFLYNLQVTHSSNYWIGLQDGAKKGDYQWSDNSAFDPKVYERWGKNQPTNNWYGNEGDCGIVNTGGLWIIKKCTNNIPYVCEIPEGACAPGWHLVNGQCFQLNSKTTMTWTDAKLFCEAQLAYLTSIKSDAENNLIKSFLADLVPQGINEVHIGVSDREKDGTFVWTDGSSPGTYTNWVKGQPPAGANSLKECGYINTADSQDAEWMAGDCFKLGAFVCKTKAGAKVTSVPVNPITDHCDPGWALHSGNCYKIIREKKTWAESDTACKASSANLVSVHGDDEQSFMSVRIDLVRQRVWIGLNDQTIEGTFVWSDSSTLDYKNWAPPGTPGSDDCVSMEGHTTNYGLWTARKCSEKNYYACRKPSIQGTGPSTPPLPTLVYNTRCGSGWEYDKNSNKCYLFKPFDYRNWFEARYRCRQLGGDLTSLSGNDDLYYASSRLKSLGGGESWIGCNDLGTEGGWVWSDGKPFSLLNWYPGQPDNWFGNSPIGEHCCTIFNDKGTWNDQFCENSIGYSCNKDDTLFRYFITYSEKKMNEKVDKTLTNVWPRECAEACLASPTNVLYCRSFDYERSTRTCYIRKIDKSAVAGGLVPTFDTQHFDHYERDVLVTPPSKPTPVPFNKYCPKDWGQYGEYCYYVNPTRDDFAGAEAECKKLGGEVTSIQDVNTNNFIRAWIQEKLPSENRFWIGLNDRKQEMLYEWSNGEAVTYTNWNAHEPNDASGEDCTELYRDSGFWNDVPCQGTSFNSICRGRVSYSNPVPPQDKTCGSGLNNNWEHIWTDRCYQIAKFTITYADAITRCNQDGGQLVVIENRMELAYLSAMLGLEDGNDYYIAFSDSGTKGYYQWEDSSPITFTNWAKGQPDDRQGNCITMNSADDAGYWTDRDCSKKNSFICEKARQGYPTIGPPVIPTPTPPSDVGCSAGWTGWGLRCFKKFELMDADAVNWDNANLACSKLGGDLASFHHPDEEKYLIKTFATKANKRFWIGFNDQRFEGGYAWSDSTQVEYTNWATGEPNDSGGKEECVETDFKSGKWNDASCWSTRNYICSIPKGSAVITPFVPTTIAVVPCNNVNWFHLKPYCYYFSSKQDGLKDWYGARDFCHSEKAHLVSIHNKLERDFVNQELEFLAGSYWIGLRSNLSHPGEHTWSDKTLLDDTNWLFLQPDTNNGEELCVELSNSPILTKGKWQDANCGLENRFVCKKNVDGSDPTHQPTVAPDGNCLPGWNQYSDKRCYKIMGLGGNGDPKLNWKDARKDCIAKGAHFASIHDDNVQTYITASMIDADDDVWIGMSALASGSKYVWTDSSTVNYVNWANDQKDSTSFLPGNGNDCIDLKYDEQETGKWKDEDCSIKHSYLCKMDPDPANVNGPASSPCKDSAMSGKNYVQFGDACFKIYTDKVRTFDDAKALCTADGTNVNLASILNGFEQAKLQSMLIDADSTKDIWIGIYDDPNVGVLNWLDGFPLHYTNWGWSDPKGLECAVMKESGLLYSPGEWSNVGCTPLIGGYYTACKYSTASPPTPEPTVPGYCESGWTAFGVSCYKVGSGIFSTASFGEAIYDCDKNYGGALVAAVRSKAENTFLKTLGQKEFNVDRLLIGIDRTNNGGWQWVDGSPLTFVNWADPNAASTGKNCAEMRFADGKWYHISCKTNSHYVCEKPKIQTFTTAPPIQVTPCKTGDSSWMMSGPYCYRVSDEFESWHDAETWCNENGGYLASIHSQTENDYITDLLTLKGYFYSNYWIGYNKLYDGSGLDDYRWTDKTIPGDYTKGWAPGEPNDFQGAQKCVHMHIDGSWEDSNCGAIENFICKRKSDSTAGILIPPPPSATGNCPEGWYKMGTGCYQINAAEADFKTWVKAREQCQTHSGGDLASIHNQGVQSLLTSLLKSRPGHMWNGLRLGTGGWWGYHWVDQSNADYSHWALNQPDYYYDEDACVVMVNDPDLPGRWNDVDCTQKHGYLCSQPLNPNQPPIEPEKGNCSVDGYLPYFDDCFKMNQTRLSFDDARQACEDEGAALATVIDGFAEAFIIAEMLFVNDVQRAWIGFKAENSTGVYGWVDRWPNLYTNWFYNSPSGPGDCTVVSQYAGWFNMDCQQKAPFICRTTTATFIPPTYAPSIPGRCPKDWIPYGDSCYVFDTGHDYSSWYEAHFLCSKNYENSVLLSIHNKAETAFLQRSIANTKSSYHTLWLDLTRNETAVDQFEFLWNDGHVFDYDNWKLGEPSPKSSGKQCAVIEPNAYGKWETQSCTYYSHYACKKPKVPLPEGGCETGWFRMKNWCYGAFGFFEPQSKTWVGAEKACNDKGGDLATVYSQGVQSLLEAMMYEMKRTNAWIGLNKMSTGFYEWSDGTPYGFSHWKDGVEDTNKDKKCVLIENHPSEPGLWKSQSCGDSDTEGRPPKGGYFCQKPSDPSLPLEPSGDTCSQPGYFKFSFNCFKVYGTADQMKTFQEAEAKCEEDGGTLSSITSGFYEAFAETLLFYYEIKDAWIGLKKGADGMFAWQSGDIYRYKNWNGGKEGTSGDCVRITNRQKWETVSCDTKHNFICEIEPPPVTEGTGTEGTGTEGTAAGTKGTGTEGTGTNGTNGTETTGNPLTPHSKTPQTSDLGGGAIAGIVIGVLVVIVLSLGLGYFLMQKSRMGRKPLDVDINISQHGFDNVTYSPDEGDVSFEHSSTNA